MFDIGWSELLVIGIVALVVIGPKELPGVIRAVAQNIGKLRRMASDFQGQFTDAVREMELSELKKDAEKLISDATSVDEFKAANEEIQKAVEGPSSASDPANPESETPAPAAEPAASPEGEALPKPEKGSGA